MSLKRSAKTLIMAGLGLGLSTQIHAAELNFDVKTMQAMMRSCQTRQPPLTRGECEKYLQGVAAGYCIARNDGTAEAKDCTAAKGREMEASLRELAEAVKKKKDAAVKQ